MRPKEQERENAQLRKAVSNRALETAIRKDAASGQWRSPVRRRICAVLGHYRPPQREPPLAAEDGAALTVDIVDAAKR
jgi:hypothetical protein